MSHKKFEQTSLLFSGNAVFIEELYQSYLSNPKAVDDSWQAFFHDFHELNYSQSKTTSKIILPETNQDIKNPQKSKVTASYSPDYSAKLQLMIDSYRSFGHHLVQLDPLGLEKLPTKAELKLNIEDFGFSCDDLASKISVNYQSLKLPDITLADFVRLLEKIYCSNFAIEVHKQNSAEALWLFEQLENSQSNQTFTEVEKHSILKDLVEVEGFEQYLHIKFPGAKRFSIEGGDSAVVALSHLIEIAAENGIAESVIGMAHRGRLSTLTKVMQKPYHAVLSEFMGNYSVDEKSDISGDVKYHMGYISKYININGREMKLTLAPNPSHLEAVNPVIAGMARAKQDLSSAKRSEIVGILIHGDAAFCGQGVVAECLTMSTLSPYQIGGIIHFVINNQVGFTANSSDTRSGRYATEFAKIINAPVLHVNGDDIESVLRAVHIALYYRQIFGKDIIIDVVCYRKYGHNEGDEPAYTQNFMYGIIKSKKSPAQIYADILTASGSIEQSYYSKLKEEFKNILDKEYVIAKDYQPQKLFLQESWKQYLNSDYNSVKTGIAKKDLQELGLKLCKIPSDFTLNSKLKKLFETRVDSLNEGKNIDWATAEQLAFASLLVENKPIRITGQDCGRGTFSHRHSVLHDQTNGQKYLPLNNLAEQQAKYFVADSNLSEYGVLGFEYGYSLVNPDHLVIWEAQFGDFANGAQIMIDQFITSAETKWQQLSGLVMLLPHGFEGQGPEHSSARLERFLASAAQNNIQVVYPTTPASFFHLLRRQIHQNCRKPLIVMTPKSLLRHKLAISTLTEMDAGTCFLPVLDEVNPSFKVADTHRVVICTGKIYYDLLEMRETQKITDTAIIRLEQLYPFATEEMIAILKKYSTAKEFIWCQEEPQNMGTWGFVNDLLNDSLHKAGLVDKKFSYAGRMAAASPAVGYLSLHTKQQDTLVKKALGIL